MKKSIINTVLSFLFVTTCYSQVFWEEIIIPNNIGILGIDVNSNNDIFLGVASSNGGGVLRKLDSNSIWDTSLYFSNDVIGPIYIDEMDNVFAASKNLYFSSDTGNNWNLLYSNPAFGLTCILVNSENHILLGTWGGIIKSDSINSPWIQVLALENTEMITTIVEDKNSGKLYAGSINFFEGGGVYQSINGGDTWENIGLTDHYVSSLALNSSGDLFAGSRGHNSLGIGGVYILPNGQTEWQVLKDDDLVISMVINSEDEIYIGCSALIYLGGGVRCSVDNGLTWTDISIESMYVYDIEGLTLGDEQHLYVHEHNGSKLYKTINSTITTANENYVKEKIDVFNYPNPFSSKTIIYYSIPETENKNVKLSIFNYEGRLIQEYTTNFNINNSIKFNATGLQSGVYYCVLSAGDMITYNKMVLKK